MSNVRCKEKNGVLFKNGRKSQLKHPDLSGRIVIDGVERWLSGWNNTSAGGNPYITVVVGDEVQDEYKSDPRPDEEPQKTGDKELHDRITQKVAERRGSPPVDGAGTAGFDDSDGTDDMDPDNGWLVGGGN